MLLFKLRQNNYSAMLYTATLLTVMNVATKEITKNKTIAEHR